MFVATPSRVRGDPHEPRECLVRPVKTIPERTLECAGFV